MSGANGTILDHPGGASVEAMDTSDTSNPLSTNSSRFTVKPSTINKQQQQHQSNKPMSPGKISYSISIDHLFLFHLTEKPMFYI